MSQIRLKNLLDRVGVFVTAETVSEDSFRSIHHNRAMKKPTNAESPFPSIYRHAVPPAWYSPPPMTEPQGEMLTTPQAAAALGVGTTTVKKLIASGELQSCVIRRSRRIRRDAIDAYLARREAGKGRRK